MSTHIITEVDEYPPEVLIAIKNMDGFPVKISTPTSIVRAFCLRKINLGFTESSSTTDVISAISKIPTNRYVEIRFEDDETDADYIWSVLNDFEEDDQRFESWFAFENIPNEP